MAMVLGNWKAREPTQAYGLMLVGAKTEKDGEVAKKSLPAREAMLRFASLPHQTLKPSRAIFRVLRETPRSSHA